MVLDLECQQKLVENFCREEGQKAGKDFRLKRIMTKLESLKKNFFSECEDAGHGAFK